MQSKKETYIKVLSALPNEVDRSFENETKKIANEGIDDLNFEKLFFSILDDDVIDQSVRYGAFAVLYSLFRRNRDHSKLMKLLDDYSVIFSERPFFDHFRLCIYVDNGEKVDSLDILETAKKHAEDFPSHPGVWCLYSEIIVKFYDDNSCLVDTKTPIENWLSESLRAANIALSLEEYPRFFYSLAGAYRINNLFSDAKDAIAKAIDREDSSKNDYQQRILMYNVELSKIENSEHYNQITKLVSEQRAKITEESDKANQNINNKIKKLEDSSTSNLEFIGLFAGIVSFTIASINIITNASQYSFLGSAGLLTILCGCLLGVYCGFGIILRGFSNTINKRYKWIAIISACIIVFGIILCLLGEYRLVNICS